MYKNNKSSYWPNKLYRQNDGRLMSASSDKTLKIYKKNTFEIQYQFKFIKIE